MWKHAASQVHFNSRSQWRASLTFNIYHVETSFCTGGGLNAFTATLTDVWATFRHIFRLWHWATSAWWPDIVQRDPRLHTSYPLWTTPMLAIVLTNKHTFFALHQSAYGPSNQSVCETDVCEFLLSALPFVLKQVEEGWFTVWQEHFLLRFFLLKYCSYTTE